MLSELEVLARGVGAVTPPAAGSAGRLTLTATVWPAVWVTR